MSTNLTSCFTSCENFESACSSFHKQLQKTLHKCFTKIRIKKGGNQHLGNKIIQAYLKARREITILKRTVSCKLASLIIENFQIKLERNLNDFQAKINSLRIRNFISSYNIDNGSFSPIGFWKLKKKLCPNPTDPPMAKLDSNGNLVTNPDGLKKIYLQTYANRLAPRLMKDEFSDIFLLKTELWRQRYKLVSNITSTDWSQKHLQKVLASLKNNKAFDPDGLQNEIFKPGCIGEDNVIFFNTFENYIFG